MLQYRAYYIKLIIVLIELFRSLTTLFQQDRFGVLAVPFCVMTRQQHSFHVTGYPSIRVKEKRKITINKLCHEKNFE
jgi:hypothetical protein